MFTDQSVKVCESQKKKEAHMKKKLKINFHITEACNFCCKFCFASYRRKQLTLEQQKLVIEKIADCGYFDSINFAGGEPLLIRQLPELIKYAVSFGLKTSVITNGFLITEQFLEEVLPNLDMIGISCHSFNEITKLKIGSCTKDGKTLSNERLAEICARISQINERQISNCKLKINSVICKQNVNENLKVEIEKLNDVQRWKSLRCQEFGTNQELLISDMEFNIFRQINQSKNLNQVFENEMKDTYIMLNPAGELLCEAENGVSYEVLGSFLNDDISKLLNKYNLKTELYFKRYAG